MKCSWKKKTLYIPFLVFYSFQSILHDILVNTGSGSVSEKPLSIKVSLKMKIIKTILWKTETLWIVNANLARIHIILCLHLVMTRFDSYLFVNLSLSKCQHMTSSERKKNYFCEKVNYDKFQLNCYKFCWRKNWVQSQNFM